MSNQRITINLSYKEYELLYIMVKKSPFFTTRVGILRQMISYIITIIGGDIPHENLMTFMIDSRTPVPIVRYAIEDKCIDKDVIEIKKGVINFLDSLVAASPLIQDRNSLFRALLWYFSAEINRIELTPLENIWVSILELCKDKRLEFSLDDETKRILIEPLT